LSSEGILTVLCDIKNWSPTKHSYTISNHENIYGKVKHHIITSFKKSPYELLVSHPQAY